MVGNLYITAETLSTGFPMVNAIDSSANGGNDVFVAQLLANGSGIGGSTDLAGWRAGGGPAIALGAMGNLDVRGETPSMDFPVASAFDASFNGGESARTSPSSRAPRRPLPAEERGEGPEAGDTGMAAADFWVWRRCSRLAGSGGEAGEAGRADDASLRIDRLVELLGTNRALHLQH